MFCVFFSRVCSFCLSGRVNSVTSLTIAHRLQTVIGSDRVLVLDKGKVEVEAKHDRCFFFFTWKKKEFGPTIKFVDIRKEGKFSQMIRDTGKASSLHLLGLAEAAAKQKQFQPEPDYELLGLETDFEMKNVVL